jgi:outer membrane murein-binding lipoprotein Lpp
MVVITWNGYSVPSGTPVSELSASAQIYNGALSVLLVPTTTAASGTYYQVVYSSSNGTITWTETWQVPPSTTPLTLSQVRTSTTEGSGTTTTTGTAQYATLPIAISEVTNLSSDLSSINASIATLNTQVAAFANSATVTTLQNSINSLSSNVTGLTSTVNGLTTTVNGLSTSVAANYTSISTLTTNLATVTSTVTGLSTSLTSLNNTVTGLQSTVNSLSAAANTAVFVDSETPGGSVNGTNTAFTLANSPSPVSSFALFRNGLLQSPGVDYTLSGMAITFLTASTPQTGDILQASYRLPGTAAATNFVDAATPSGTINGTNLTFTLAYTPNPLASVKLYKNGLLLAQPGDYSVSGTTITFASAATTPQTGDTLVVSYRH